MKSKFQFIEELALGSCAYIFPFGEGGFFSRRRREKKTDEVGRHLVPIEMLIKSKRLLSLTRPRLRSPTRNCGRIATGNPVNS